jgi:hypothetical protein
MSTWHKQITQSLADSVAAVLNDMKEDQKTSQNKMLKQSKGEPVGQIKPKQTLPEEDEEENGNGENGKKKKKNPFAKKKNGNGNGNGNGDEKLDPVDKNAVKKKFDDREDQDLDNDGDTDASDKFLHKKRKAITKAIRKTSRNGKKIDLSGKKEKVTVNPDVKEDFATERATLREALEASFDTVFQYSNKEEEAYRDQWMGQFDSLVSGKEPSAYIDPLQRRVFYIEGITPEQAANRYLSLCVSNAAMSGGEYVKYGNRGGDPSMSSKNQGQGSTNVYHSRHQVKHN